MKRQILLLLILLSAMVFAQDDIIVSEMSLSDSLVLASPDTLQAFRAFNPQVEWNRQRILGLSMLAVFSGLAFHFSEQAEDNYDAYLSSGSYSEMDRLFSEVEHYDKLTGLSYLGVELGFILTLRSFDTSWHKTKKQQE